MSIKLETANLIKEVSQKIGYERGSICGYDCLMNWNSGGDRLLSETITAWKRYLKEVEEKESHTDCNRHGVWVPAIPL